MYRIQNLKQILSLYVLLGVYYWLLMNEIRPLDITTVYGLRSQYAAEKASRQQETIISSAVPVQFTCLNWKRDVISGLSKN